jgi:hypothetical protein
MAKTSAEADMFTRKSVEQQSATIESQELQLTPELTLYRSLGSQRRHSAECSHHEVLEGLVRRLARIVPVLLEARNLCRILAASKTFEGAVERARLRYFGDVASLLNLQGGDGAAHGGGEPVARPRPRNCRGGSLQSRHIARRETIRVCGGQLRA